jgi:hypothetical protein
MSFATQGPNLTVKRGIQQPGSLTVGVLMQLALEWKKNSDVGFRL